MKINQVDMRISFLEGGAKQCDIAQIKEIRKIIAMEMARCPETHKCLMANGHANLRAEKKRLVKLLPKLPKFLK